MAEPNTQQTITSGDRGNTITTTNIEKTYTSAKKKIVFANDENEYEINAKTEITASNTGLTTTREIVSSSQQRSSMDGTNSSAFNNDVSGTLYSTNSNVDNNNYTKNEAGVIINTSPTDYDNARKAKKEKLKAEKDEAELKNNISRLQNEVPLDIKELREIVSVLLQKAGGTIQDVEESKIPESEAIEKIQIRIFTKAKDLYMYVSNIIRANDGAAENPNINFCGFTGNLHEDFGNAFSHFSGFNTTKIKDNIGIVALKDEYDVPTGLYALDAQTALDFYNYIKRLKDFTAERSLIALNSLGAEYSLVEPLQTNNTEGISIDSFMKRFSETEQSEHGSIINKESNSYRIMTADAEGVLDDILSYYKVLVKLNNMNMPNIDSSSSQQNPNEQSVMQDPQLLAVITSLQESILNIQKTLDGLIKNNPNIATYSEIDLGNEIMNFSKWFGAFLVNYIDRNKMSYDSYEWSVTHTAQIISSLKQTTIGQLLLNDKEGGGDNNVDRIADEYDIIIGKIEQNVPVLDNKQAKTIFTEINFTDLGRLLYKGVKESINVNAPGNSNLDLLQYINVCKNWLIEEILGVPVVNNIEVRKKMFDTILEFLNITNNREGSETAHHLTDEQKEKVYMALGAAQEKVKKINPETNEPMIDPETNEEIYEMVYRNYYDVSLNNHNNVYDMDFKYVLRVYNLLNAYIDKLPSDPEPFTYPLPIQQLQDPIIKRYYYDNGDGNGKIYHTDIPEDPKIDYVVVHSVLPISEWYQLLLNWIGADGFIKKKVDNNGG